LLQSPFKTAALEITQLVLVNGGGPLLHSSKVVPFIGQRTFCPVLMFRHSKSV
jgi:hypothetical protein